MTTPTITASEGKVRKPLVPGEVVGKRIVPQVVIMAPAPAKAGNGSARLKRALRAPKPGNRCEMVRQETGGKDGAEPGNDEDHIQALQDHHFKIDRLGQFQPRPGLLNHLVPAENTKGGDNKKGVNQNHQGNGGKNSRPREFLGTADEQENQ